MDLTSVLAALAVASYRQQMGLKAVLAVRQVNTTVPIKEHKKYPSFLAFF
jgi:hypothetical protein